MKFEWDIDKEKRNIKKHGINFEQGAFVFSDPFALTLFDKEHSNDENRWILLGQSNLVSIIVVVHTYTTCDNSETVRIISARKANKKEQSYYNQRLPK